MTLDEIRAELQRRMAPSVRGRRASDMLNFVPRIQCADGFNFSMQSGRYSYCTPRDDDGPWSAVELGFPSADDVVIRQYAEDADAAPETVYGWVPLDVVAKLIESHDGFAADK